MSVSRIDLSTPPPSVNNAFINLPGRGRVKSKQYRAWTQAAAWEVAAQRPRRITGYVIVDMSIGRTTRASDIDNRCKGILDLLVQTGVIEDDRYVDEIRARWVAKPGCRILVMAIGGNHGKRELEADRQRLPAAE